MNIKKDTIINLLYVFIPLFVLLIIIAPKYLRKGEEAKHTTAVLQIKIIEEAIEQYFKDNRKYPTTEEGLYVLTVRKNKNGNPFLAKLPNDPWGDPYQYCNPGIHNVNKYDLWSYRADMTADGNKINSDITNWNK